MAVNGVDLSMAVTYEFESVLKAVGSWGLICTLGLAEGLGVVWIWRESRGFFWEFC